MVRQIAQFIGISGIGWLLDFAVFNLLCLFSQNLLVNNFFSSFVGVSFVFAFATRRVFVNNHHVPLIWKYGCYLFYQVILIYLVSVLLEYLNGYIMGYVVQLGILSMAPAISKIMITPVTMVCNFVVMKGLIEKL